jgi:DmsE family decaheme c-type cytochrome
MKKHSYFQFAVIFSVFITSDVGADLTCSTCHADHSAALQETPHKVLISDSDTTKSCVSCHGAATEHMRNPSSGGVKTFTGEVAQESSAVCATCHSEKQAANRGVHARAGLACSDCHKVHSEADPEPLPAGFEDVEFGSANCAGCHEDILAQFSFNESHRLSDNSVTCVSCHDPHASSERLRLGGLKQQACAKCHADKDGPYVFEHAASRVDGCVACHSPHGSVNRHLLAHQEVGEQCYSCHAEVPQFHLGFAPSGAPRFGNNTVCTNCHVSIHGSNVDRFFLK